MPTIIIWNGFRFHFFSNEGNEPPHIHIEKAECEAKFWLNDCSLAYSDGFKQNDLRKLKEFIVEKQAFFLQKWKEFHDR